MITTKRTVFLVMLLVLPFVSCTQKMDIDPEKEELLIQKTFMSALEAEKQMNLDGLMDVYASNIVIHVNGKPRLEGKETVWNFYREFFKQPVVSFDGGTEKIVVSSSGDMAFDIGWLKLKMKGTDGITESRSKYCAVWQKTGNEWKIAVLSVTSDLP